MNIKNITASSMLVLALIFSSTIYADNETELSNEITENNNSEIITENENGINNLETISEEETEITEVEYTQAESFELLLQKYLKANQAQKEGILWKIARIGTRESLLLALPLLIVPVHKSMTSLAMGIKYADQPVNFEIIKNFLKEIVTTMPAALKKMITNTEDIVNYAAMIIPAYIFLRSAYAVAQIGTAPTPTPNLKLLTKIVKLWEGYKTHLPEELHQTFEILNVQYLKNKKLNMDEATAQKIINEMLQVSLSKMNEDSLAVENSPEIIA